MPNKLTAIQFRERLYRRRYLVPNAVTLANLFCGFLAIIYASSGRFEKAVLAILIAILLDGLDGRVARRLNATSKFGLEFDSFSDLVSFGVAPAMLMYHWAFQQVADEWGVLMTFGYALCAASRLARFNITAENLTGFDGLPTPGAAAMMAAMVNLGPRIEQTISVAIMGTSLTALLAYLMVSKISFFSIKKLKIHSMNLPLWVSLGGLIALVWYSPKIGFVALAGSYCLSGPVKEVIKDWRSRGGRGPAAAHEQELVK